MNYNQIFESLDLLGEGKHIFAHINGQKHLYKDLSDTINKLQTYFKDNQLKKGDRVVLSVKDDYYTSVFFLAFLKYGLTTVFIDPDLPSNSVNPLITKAAPKAIVQDELLNTERDISGIDVVLNIKKEKQKKGKLFNRLLKSKKNTPTSDTSFPGILNQLQPSSAFADIQGDDIAYIIFTSGTTAQPKGVMISYKNVMSHLKTLSETYGLNEDSRILNILMLYHADGIIQGPLLTLYNKATWYNPFKFDVSKLEDLFYSVYKYDISHFITVPTILSFMNKFSDGYEDSFEHDGFKTIVSVASKLELQLWNTIEKKFKTTLINVYGLTETVAGALFCGLEEGKRRVGTVGLPIDCEAKLTDDNHQEVSDSNSGLLWLKGDHIFSGYLNDSDSTNAVMVDGWLNTGDIASRDCDGFYTITGRLKNTINTGGINIYPEQITEVINTHPNVLESVCFGVEDDFFGEKIVSAVVYKSVEQTNSSNELIEFLRPQLHHHQIPKEFHFLEELPKGLSGKVKMNEIKSLVKSIQNSEKKEEADYKTSILSIASTVFNIQQNKITMEDNSASVDGWDSMGHLVFITELEKQFKVQFSTSEMMRMNSFKTANLILQQKLSDNG